MKHLPLKKFTSILKDTLLSHRLWPHYVLGIITTEEKNTGPALLPASMQTSGIRQGLRDFLTSSLPEPGKERESQQDSWFAQTARLLRQLRCLLALPGEESPEARSSEDRVRQGSVSKAVGVGET